MREIVATQETGYIGGQRCPRGASSSEDIQAGSRAYNLGESLSMSAINSVCWFVETLHADEPVASTIEPCSVPIVLIRHTGRSPDAGWNRQLAASGVMLTVIHEGREFGD